jgi:hypothetical protein
MDLDVRVVSIAEFLRYDASGEYDFESSKAVVAEIAKSLVELKKCNILLDLRNAIPKNISAGDIYSLVLHFLSFGPPQGNRLAILNDPKDEVDRAMIFSMGVNRQGFDVASFHEFEPAMEWLSDYQT